MIVIHDTDDCLTWRHWIALRRPASRRSSSDRRLLYWIFFVCDEAYAKIGQHYCDRLSPASLIGYLFTTAPDSASAAAVDPAGVGGIITLLLKQGATDADVATAKHAAVIGVEKSEQNARVLAVVKADVAQNTAVTTHANEQIRELKITVDGRLTKLLEQTEIAARLSGAQEERDRSTDSPRESGATPPRGTQAQS